MLGTFKKSINDIMQSYPSTKICTVYKDDVSPSMVDGNGRLKSDTNVISIEGESMMRTNDHITDLDAIELSSGWNYNSKLETGKMHHTIR